MRHKLLHLNSNRLKKIFWRFVAFCIACTPAALLAQGEEVLDSTWTKYYALDSLPFEDVVKLDLRYIDTIPKKILIYKNLEILELNQNRARTLPDGIVELKKLKKVFLGGTYNLDIDDAFKKLKYVKTITEIDLWNRGLDHLPRELYKMEQLEVLNFDLNDVDTLYPQIGRLAGLRVLRLAGNKRIRAFPPNLLKLTRLEELDLSQTSIPSLPNYMGQLNKIKYLGLADLPITALPKDFTKLTELEVLNLGFCKNLNWADALRQLSQLKKLRVLYMNHTVLANVDTSAVQLPTLDTLFASNVVNVKLLLPALRRCPRLVYLDLKNTFCGEMLAIVFTLHSLRHLDLSSMSLKAVPEGILLLENLETLCLQYNNITIESYALLQGLPRLKRLVISYSQYDKREVERLKKLLPNVEIVF